VAIAHLLSEDRVPPAALWDEHPVSSRLLQYEVWNRVHRTRPTPTQIETTREFLARIDLIELSPPVLARALDPFPEPVRTLDALHLASLEFLRANGQRPRLASYDHRLVVAARALGVPVLDLP
jgi:hypothetical protein